MRLHFAVEFILELIVRKFQLEKVGVHISELKARIDFKSENNFSVIFEEILKEYNQIIQSDSPILTGFSDIQNQRRF
jgi:Ser-tRNA(Ala) deacylase AlaX